MVAEISLDQNVRFTNADVMIWAGSTSNPEFYNSIALRIAEQYSCGALTYEVCDHIVNDLWQVVQDCYIPLHNAVPDMFYDVFLAFDAGEYHRTADLSDDPVAKYTKPMIEEILHHGFLKA
jgi:hypothetical protein